MLKNMPVPSGRVWASATPAESRTCERELGPDEPREAGGGVDDDAEPPLGRPGAGTKLLGWAEPGGRKTPAGAPDGLAGFATIEPDCGELAGAAGPEEPGDGVAGAALVA